MQFVPLILATPLLIWIAWTDFRIMRIRNSAVMAAAALFLATAPLLGWPEAAFRLLAAALVFGVSLGLFAARLIGGGDVKMATALVALVPTDSYPDFSLSFSLAILIGILAMAALRSVPALRRRAPVSLRARGTFPMGVAFALSSLLLLVIAPSPLSLWWSAP